MIDLSPWLGGVPDATIERLAAARQVLAVGHENPDADTIGASLAVARIVETQGGQATIVCGDPVPRLYDFIPGVSSIRSEPDPETAYDLLVISDCGGLDRIGSVYPRFQALFDALPLVIIDHHASTRDGGPADWVEPGSAATCEMLTLLVRRLEMPLATADGGLATALMAGIVMDTATFAHPNTTPRTLAVGAALLEAGAPLAEISRRLYRSKPAEQLQLFGRVLSRLETTAGGRIVHASFLDEDFAASGADPAHSEGLIDLLSQAEAADVVLLFKPAGSATRVSVRTRPGGVDATVLTGRFGGGGHARAAGATIEDSLEPARARVLAEAERLIERLGG
jgi:phosphoesterase RecJ-like protein